MTRKQSRFQACAHGLALLVVVIASCSASDSPGGGRRAPTGAGGSTAGSGGTTPITGAGGFGAPSAGGNRAPLGGGNGAAQDAGMSIAGPVPMAIDECPGSVAADVAQRLRDPGVPVSGTPWLYPYDRTVFPRGMIAPVLQWDEPAGGATAVFIHLKSMFLDYQLCLRLTEPMRVQIPQAAWDLAAAQSRGRSDPLTLEVVLASGPSAQRLPALTLIFALADLKGAVYYNTYGSLLAMNMGISGGVVMRILPREPEPAVFATASGTADQCIGCHSVSADGSRMVAEVHSFGGIAEGPSRSFDLTMAGTGTNPPALRDNLMRAGFSGVYPDGSVYVTTGRATALGAGDTVTPSNVTGTFGPEESKLFDMQTGNEIPNSGIHPYAYMPTFATDGMQVVFNKMDATAMAGHALAVMDFDRASNRFSNPRDVFTDPNGYPAWPFFLPDVVSDAEISLLTGKRVVFALNAGADFVTGGTNFMVPSSADLWWVDVDSGMAAALDRANGYEGGMLYLPYGEDDAHKNFVPTVSPVAAGGYFWIFFTSRRSYGNVQVVDPATNSPEGKQIWAAALNIEATPGSDPSHPAFYLPNQEAESGNIRAFAALEPCRAEGATCATGVDCCCGFCIKADANAAEGQCGCEPDRCSNIDEKCETAADCCDPAASCVGGFCQWLVD